MRFGDVHDINFTVAVDVAIFHYDEGGFGEQKELPKDADPQ